MKKKVLILLTSLFLLLIIIFLMCLIAYNYCLEPVDKNDYTNITFTVQSGSTLSSVIESLDDENLIKSSFALKLYSKLHQGVVQSGTYVFTKAMSAKEIYTSLINGDATFDTVWVTFLEGKRVTYVATVIAENFNYTYDEVMEVIEDEEFIESLIDEYEVLTDDILDDDIYYALEGYLFPDTYEFLSSASIESILETMVGAMNNKVLSYSEKLEESTYSVHELLTLASIVEMEGTNSENRKGIAEVFYNRLSAGWTLGSDVTTYYGVQKDFSEDLYLSDLQNCNPYNTSSYGCIKGLPAGPISTISLESIEAVLYPDDNDYYYFVSDKNGNIYFSKTSSEHEAIISKLKSEGLWYYYE